MNGPHHNVLALRYATSNPGRLSHENFLLPSDRPDAPMPLDYFIWAAQSADRTIVIDTGFGPEAAVRRGRTLLRPPAEALRSAGIEPNDVEDVILTHLHYDHAGGLEAFPKARFHIQDSEMAFATGRSMCHACLRQPFDVEDVIATVRLVYGGRVVFHSAESVVAPGVTVHRVGGHTGGLQVVRVSTARGPLVIASDAFHFDANRRRRNPFPIVKDVSEMLDGYLRCEALADGDDSLLVPGHDPEVLARWPALSPGLQDVVRLHEAPHRG